MLNCAACGGTFKAQEPHHEGLYINRRGQAHPHVLCPACTACALSGSVGRADVAERVELHFTDAEGRA